MVPEDAVLEKQTLFIPRLPVSSNITQPHHFDSLTFSFLMYRNITEKSCIEDLQWDLELV